MKYDLLVIAFTVSAFAGCSKDSESSPGSVPGPDVSDCKLVEISTQGGHRTYSYEYDSAGHLVRENEKWNDILRIWRVLRYANGRLVAREHWTDYPSNPVRLAGYDTLVYNSLGLVAEMRSYSKPDSPSPHRIYRYTYDSKGRPITRQSIDPEENQSRFSYKYFWENGNITKVEDYAGDFEALLHEWFYVYGQALNYQKQLALFPEHPENQNANMVYKVSAKDYTGLLDLACNPCYLEYDVNADGFPTALKYPWNQGDTFLEWDCD